MKTVSFFTFHLSLFFIAAPHLKISKKDVLENSVKSHLARSTLVHPSANLAHGVNGLSAAPLVEAEKRSERELANVLKVINDQNNPKIIFQSFLKGVDKSQCENNGQCEGEPVEERVGCNEDNECPPECEWSPDWEPWSPCTVTCGGGSRQKTKKCECKNSDKCEDCDVSLTHTLKLEDSHTAFSQ